MRIQTEDTTMGSSIGEGNAPPCTERKSMRVIDFSQAKTPTEKQELFDDFSHAMRGVFDRRQAEWDMKPQHRWLTYRLKCRLAISTDRNRSRF
jgi:hypothetical protein